MTCTYTASVGKYSPRYGMESGSFARSTDLSFLEQISHRSGDAGQTPSLLLLTLLPLSLTSPLLLTFAALLLLLPGERSHHHQLHCSIRITESQISSALPGQGIYPYIPYCFPILRLSLSIHAPVSFWHSAASSAICSYCFISIQPCSAASMEKYARIFIPVSASC